MARTWCGQAFRAWVDKSKFNIAIIWHLYLSGMRLGVDLRMNIKRHIFKRDYTTCLKYANHSMLNSQQLRGPIWLFYEHENLPLIMSKMSLCLIFALLRHAHCKTILFWGRNKSNTMEALILSYIYYCMFKKIFCPNYCNLSCLPTI